MKRRLFLSLAITSLLLFLTGVVGKAQGAPSDRFSPETDTFTLNDEVRAAWIATVQGIDWPNKDDSPASQKDKLVKMIKAVREAGCNTVYFQVVSNMDAMYPSKLLPWSHSITGTQGKNPGYDPLQLAVETCSDEGLEIHAWINPLRAGGSNMERASNHVVKSHPSWTKTYKKNSYLNPALPEVRTFLSNIVKELLDNYDLDGIHIDDYFYPAGIKDDEDTWDDEGEWKNSGTALSKDDWRTENINKCVSAIYDATHASGKDVIFGVSPGGRLVNTLKIYGDPRCWIDEGTIDYLIPQIYWQHGHAIADFPTVMESWREIMQDVPMFTGLAAYRWGEKGFESLDEFKTQVQECRDATFVMGHAWFSTKSILRDEFKKHLQETSYVHRALVPYIGCYPLEIETPSLAVLGRSLLWKRIPEAENYIVYELERVEGEKNKWSAFPVYRGETSTFRGEDGKNYVVVACIGKQHSAPSNPVYIEKRR